MMNICRKYLLCSTKSKTMITMLRWLLHGLFLSTS